MSQHGKVREYPRISVQKLGEYLDASASRRERIIHDQKFPPAFKQRRYRAAEHEIREALTANESDELTREHLLTSRNKLKAHITTTPYQDNAKSCCMEALTLFAEILPKIRSSGAVFTSPSWRGIPVHIEGVKISVFPLVISNRSVKERTFSGATIAVFKKSGPPLSEKSGKAIASLLYHSLSQEGMRNLSAADCIAIDVFSGNIFRASPRYQRILSDISSACREMAIRWPTLRQTKAA